MRDWSVAPHRHRLDAMPLGGRSLVRGGEGVGLAAAARSTRHTPAMLKGRPARNSAAGLAVDLAALLGLHFLGFAIDIGVLGILHVVFLQILLRLVIALV